MAAVAGDQRYEFMDYPMSWTEKYSEDHKQSIHQITDWLNRNKKNRTWLTQTSTVNRSTG